MAQRPQVFCACCPKRKKYATIGEEHLAKRRKLALKLNKLSDDEVKKRYDKLLERQAQEQSRANVLTLCDGHQSSQNMLIINDHE